MLNLMVVKETFSADSSSSMTRRKARDKTNGDAVLKTKTQFKVYNLI